MIYERMNVENLKIAYIGGGSRGWAWGFMKDLINDEQICGTVRLYDIDVDAAKRNQILGRKLASLPQAKSQWSFDVSYSLSEALTGADFVVISILPGDFDAMESDVHLPERVGVWQSVGDTVGPGGFIRSLRTIPMFSEIGHAIKDFSPNAWVINYTNPMSTCIRTLYEVFPKIKAFGCCHEVFSTQKLLCSMLDDICGITGITRQEIKTSVIGINHFTWISKAVYNDIDLFPIYRTFAEKHQISGYTKSMNKNWMNNPFECSHKVKLDLFLRYGVIAAAGDRHLAEFLPPWYIKNPEHASKWGFSLTKVSWRKEDLKNRISLQNRMLNGEEVPVLKDSGEEGHLLIKAILGLGDMISNVNLPNRGQISNIRDGVIVETNALFRKDEISPVCSGSLPFGVDSLVARHVYNQEATVQAALSCNRSLAFNIFMNDPLMGCVGLEDGKQLFNDMIRNTLSYLPIEWRSCGATF